MNLFCILPISATYAAYTQVHSRGWKKAAEPLLGVL